MKISNAEYIRAAKINRTSNDEQTSHVKPAKAPDVPSESITFSETAQTVKKIKRIVEDMPEVREEVVAELKAKIEAGEYKVSSEDIADLMIRRARADSIR
ncbi:MAG: flagellar biosynthesis anti-sigma factor FlgM [bacterium]|jgi:negative regulator of flagellin synthesis FlgM